MDKIQCSVFSVNFDENMVTFRVPPAVLERGIKTGMASIDFSDITGCRKTYEQGESPATAGNKSKPPASHKVDITLSCNTCVRLPMGIFCCTCKDLSNYKQA